MTQTLGNINIYHLLLFAMVYPALGHTQKCKAFCLPADVVVAKTLFD